MSRPTTRKVILLVWACALAFGLTFQTALADSLHSGCVEQCDRICKGECEVADLVGPCTCLYICSNGNSGTTVCVA